MAVIQGELFAGADESRTIEQKTPLAEPPNKIGIAAVVDKLGATAAHSPVNHEVSSGNYQILIVRWNSIKLERLIQG